MSKPTSMAHFDNVSKAYVYEDDNVKIVYDFWSAGGASRCVVTNKTDQIVYIDLDKSFLVVDQTSYSYYSPNYVLKDATYYTDKICQPIAPKASLDLSGLDFGFSQYKDCEFDVKPKMHAPVTKSFDEHSTPGSFRNILSYRVGENSLLHMVTCEFYISSVTNYRATDIEKRVSNNIYYCPNMNVYTPSANLNSGQLSAMQRLLDEGYTSSATLNSWQYRFSPATGFYVVYSQIITE